MIDSLQDLSAPALSRAVEANQVALFQHFRSWPQAEVHAAADLTWTMTAVPFPLFNSVLGARLSPETVDVAIEAAIARSLSRHVPLMWWTGPSTQPADLAAKLESYGFISEGLSPGMAVDLAALPEQAPLPANISIEYIDGADSLREWADVLCTGFAMPGIVGDAMFDWSVNSGFHDSAPYRNYLGRWNGEPVATSSVFLGGGVAGIYNVCTLPQARRNGIGAAMTVRPLLDARAQGYRVGILHSSDMGYKVYRQLGFQEYCKIGQYVWGGAHQPEAGQ